MIGKTKNAARNVKRAPSGGNRNPITFNLGRKESDFETHQNGRAAISVEEPDLGEGNIEEVSCAIDGKVTQTWNRDYR